VKFDLLLKRKKISLVFWTQMISQSLAKHLYFFEYENAFLQRPVKNLMCKKTKRSSDFCKGILLGVTVKGHHFTQQDQQSAPGNRLQPIHAIKQTSHKSGWASLMYHMNVKNFSTK